MAVEGPGKALKVVNLDDVGGEQEQRWYLDSNANNHMMGSKEAFSELDGNVIGTVKFSDGSRVAIRGRGTIIFRCQNGKHHALTNVYYIPQLRSLLQNIYLCRAFCVFRGGQTGPPASKGHGKSWLHAADSFARRGYSIYRGGHIRTPAAVI